LPGFKGNNSEYEGRIRFQRAFCLLIVLDYGQTEPDRQTTEQQNATDAMESSMKWLAVFILVVPTIAVSYDALAANPRWRNHSTRGRIAPNMIVPEPEVD
jgi:hypothetical protein